MADEKKIIKSDVLDEIKEAEKKIKRASFLKMIPKLKEMAREVNVLKKKADMMLEEVGLDEKDIKRVIDFINSLPSVTLSDKDIRDMKEEVVDEVDESKRKAERDFEQSLEKFASLEKMNYGGGAGGGIVSYYSTSGTSGSTNGWGGSRVSATGGSMLASLSMKEADNEVTLNSGANSVNVKI